MGREGSSRGPKDTGLTDLRADLDFYAGFLGELGDGKTAADAAILRQANIEVIAGAEIYEPLCLSEADERLVCHDGNPTLSAHLFHPLDIIGTNGLFDHR